MARSKNRTQSKPSKKESIVAATSLAAVAPAPASTSNGHAASSSSSTSTRLTTAMELLARAEAILNDSEDVELASQFVERASSLASSQEERHKCSEVRGMIELEKGEDELAKKHFMECQGTSATALLYLAQLSDSPLEAITNYRGAVQVLSRSIDILPTPASESQSQQGKFKAWSEAERETRLKISEALVAMTELYLTDLCFEADAEARCTEFLDLALRVDSGADINPEIYSTLASVRLSQQRNDEARELLHKSYSIWSDLPPESTRIPSFTARLNLARLLIEVDSLQESMEILEGLEEENDEELEVLYLIGFVNFLAGEEKQEEEAKDQGKAVDGAEDGMTARDHFLDSREALDRFMQLAQRKPDDVDPGMGQAVVELIGQIEGEKGITMNEVVAEEASKSAVRPSQEGGEDDGWIDDDDEDDEDME